MDMGMNRMKYIEIPALEEMNIRTFVSFTRVPGSSEALTDLKQVADIITVLMPEIAGASPQSNSMASA